MRCKSRRESHANDTERSLISGATWVVEWHISKKVSGHPNIIQVLDTFYSARTPVEKGNIVFIMELCHPHDLADFMCHYADIHIADATLWLLHICTGLKRLHSHEVMRRDLKPGHGLLFHRLGLAPSLKLGGTVSAAVLVRARRSQEQGLSTQALLQYVTTFQHA